MHDINICELPKVLKLQIQALLCYKVITFLLPDWLQHLRDWQPSKGFNSRVAIVQNHPFPVESLFKLPVSCLMVFKNQSALLFNKFTTISLDKLPVSSNKFFFYCSVKPNR